MVADALSGINKVTMPTIDFQQLAADQENSSEIHAHRTAISDLVLQDIPFHGISLLCDVSQGRPRPVIPREWTYRVFDAAHSLAHAGPRPTQRAVAERFVRHGLKKDIKRWGKECHSFHAAKVHSHTKAPISSRNPPSGRFLSFHVDLVGPLPPSEGMTYLFTAIDRFTRWPEAIPLPDAKTSTCVKALIRS